MGWESLNLSSSNGLVGDFTSPRRGFLELKYHLIKVICHPSNRKKIRQIQTLRVS